MGTYKYLSTNLAILDRYHLERYLEKMATSHVIKEKSDKYTYPVKRLKNNYLFIDKTYRLLNENVKMSLPIHPSR